MSVLLWQDPAWLLQDLVVAQAMCTTSTKVNCRTVARPASQSLHLEWRRTSNGSDLEVTSLMTALPFLGPCANTATGSQHHKCSTQHKTYAHATTPHNLPGWLLSCECTSVYLCLTECLACFENKCPYCSNWKIQRRSSSRTLAFIQTHFY